MSISQSLAAAMSGLSANARAAQAVSTNIANASTEGYGVAVVSTTPNGGGVVATVERQTNPYLIAERRIATGAEGESREKADAYQRLEEIVGVVGTPGSLTGRLGALDTALAQAASAPQSETRLNTVAMAFEDVTNHLNTASRRIQVLRQDSDASIGNQVDRVNSILGQLETINGDLVRARATGIGVASIEDQRQILVDELSQIIPVRELERSQGQTALVTPSGAVLLDGRAAELEFTPTPFIAAELRYSEGTLPGLSLNGQPVDMTSASSRLGGGSLAGAFAVRDTIAVDLQAELDNVAEDLIARFQGPAVDPTQFATDPGLLTDAGSAYTLTDNVGLSARISVNPAVLPDVGGSTRLLRDGLGSLAPGPIADGTQLNAWRDALTAPRLQADGTNRSADGVAGALGSLIGSARVNADTNLAYTVSRADTLREAEFREGVDTDAELQKLLVIEQAFAANARVIQTASDMIQQIMEI